MSAPQQYEGVRYVFFVYNVEVTNEYIVRSRPSQNTQINGTSASGLDVPKLPEVDTSLSLEQIINGEAEKYNLDPRYVLSSFLRLYLSYRRFSVFITASYRIHIHTTYSSISPKTNSITHTAAQNLSSMSCSKKRRM